MSVLASSPNTSMTFSARAPRPASSKFMPKTTWEQGERPTGTSRQYASSIRSRSTGWDFPWAVLASSTRSISSGYASSFGVTTRCSSLNISPGLASNPAFSTTCCRCPTRARRSIASLNMSIAFKPRWGGRSCWRIPRPISLSRRACWAETDFLAELAERTGCGLLLDVNNVYVASINHARNAADYLAAFPMHRVGEIHLAGHSPRIDANGMTLLVDSHDRPVAEPVWDLYGQAIARAGRVPTLIERDADIPSWEELQAEARRAQNCLAASAHGGDLAVAR